MPDPNAVFRPFSLNLDTLELRRDAIRVPLEPQPARLLALLVSREGRPVSKAEAAACLWGDNTHVSQSEGLHYAIRQIRLALGDSAAAPRYVETLPRLGFRFVAPVRFRSDRMAARCWRRFALAAAVAAVVVVVETRPNQHHQTAVWLLETIHAAFY